MEAKLKKFETFSLRKGAAIIRTPDVSVGYTSMTGATAYAQKLKKSEIFISALLFMEWTQYQYYQFCS